MNVSFGGIRRSYEAGGDSERWVVGSVDAGPFCKANKRHCCTAEAKMLMFSVCNSVSMQIANGC